MNVLRLDTFCHPLYAVEVNTNLVQSRLYGHDYSWLFIITHFASIVHLWNLNTLI